MCCLVTNYTAQPLRHDCSLAHDCCPQPTGHNPQLKLKNIMMVQVRLLVWSSHILSSRRHMNSFVGARFLRLRPVHNLLKDGVIMWNGGLHGKASAYTYIVSELASRALTIDQQTWILVCIRMEMILLHKYCPFPLLSLFKGCGHNNGIIYVL